MALFVWPAIEAIRTSDYSFTGGREVSADLQSGGRYSVFLSTTARYWLTLHHDLLRTDVLAPSPYDSVSEAQAVRDCIAALKRGDLAQIADPVDGVLRAWRLDGDRVTFQQIPDTPFFEAEVALRSVP